MRYLVAILLSICVANTAYASHIECVGKATQLINGRDTLYIFRDEIHLQSTIGNVDWYDTDGKLIASNVEEIFPDNGGYYIQSANLQSMPVYVFLYEDIPTTMTATVQPECNATTLTLHGTIDPIYYKRLDGTIGTYARTCVINYNALAWNTEQWVDSAAQIVTTFQAGDYDMPPLYGPTEINICCEPELRAALELDSLCITTELLLSDIKAVKTELTSIATTRGKEGEKSNERNRPTSQTIIESSEYSGELEVAFYSNPTPAATFYTWNIYHGADLIVSRNDENIRYVFSSPGSYRVVCAANNTHCATDSSEMVVNISESYLAVPNVFTPNGDGKNDEFRVAYRSLKEFHCWVYNRWGKLVYEWTDPAKGWDGTINGRPAAEGAYYYVIRAKGTDADKYADYIGLKAVYNKKKLNADKSVIGIYQMSGDINLIRGSKR